MTTPTLAAQGPVVHLTAQTRIIAGLIAIAFMVFILELIRRDRLQERYSVVWFLAGLGMFAGALFPGLLTAPHPHLMGVRRHRRHPLLVALRVLSSPWRSTSA